MDYKTIGKRIRKYREQQGIKQESFAELVELSPTYLSAMERGVKLPSLETFIRIANTLKVPSDFLLTDVLIAGNQIEASKLSEKLNSLPAKEQQKIFNVVDVMINDAFNNK